MVCLLSRTTRDVAVTYPIHYGKLLQKGANQANNNIKEAISGVMTSGSTAGMVANPVDDEKLPQMGSKEGIALQIAEARIN